MRSFQGRLCGNLFPLLLLVCGLHRPGLAQSSSIVSHPRELKYSPLSYQPPKAADYRRVLKNGVVVYLVENHEFPLVNVSVIIRTGAYLDPTGKVGLAAAVAQLMRIGGTKTYRADQFDEEVDFLAANLSSAAAGTQATASLNCLSKDLNKGLQLFFEMLRDPAFQQDRLDLYKNQMMQSMERRNDRSEVILSREWGRLLRGTQHFSTAEPTKASVESFTHEDLVQFHREYYHPGSFIFAVSGDFQKAEVEAQLEAMMQGWARPDQSDPPVPKPEFVPKPGVYLVNKPEFNQGNVLMGHLGSMRDNPDYYALSLMNDILGGGGVFTNWIMSRVRSDEGLAYGAGSDYGFGVYYDGIFHAEFQSKSSTCAQAAAIILEEIERIRTTKVSSEDLETAKAAAIEIFPRYFARPVQIAGTFANDEYTHRKPDFWDTYRDRIKAVTIDDILRVAQKYLMPEKLVYMAVGNVDDILKGNPDKPQFSFKKLSHTGEVQVIPLPDPLTLVYPK
ncbi:MAG: pitrilysin family protein [Terriglobia bacterium]